MLFLLLFELSIIFGFLLDLLLADPPKMPHPVVIIGKCITVLEKALRKVFPKTAGCERTAGRLMAGIITVLTYAVTMGLCIVAWMIHPACFLLLHTLWCWQAIAVRGLAREAKNVYGYLSPECDIEGARRAVSRIVGRDTQELTPEGVTKAAVETVAESFSDGVAVPFFYMMIGGAPLALTYKAINTMDSMVGYKNEKYINFGRGPAHLDDLAGLIPSRLAALMWIAAAGMMEKTAKNAWRIWRRDNRNHPSPNSAQTESACAGALGVQLAGPAYYFGELYNKPTIGDKTRPIEPDDILKTNRMMYAASLISLLLTMAVSAAIIIAVI
ncbi:MAG: adenosylcobinamide-phosphate synthase CbiB [Bacillota bacterium]